MTTNEKFGIYFGALGDPLEDQLKRQGFTLDEEDAVQQDMVAVSRLHIRGLLSDSAAHTVRMKLLRKITKEMKPIQA